MRCARLQPDMNSSGSRVSAAARYRAVRTRKGADQGAAGMLGHHCELRVVKLGIGIGGGFRGQENSLAPADVTSFHDSILSYRQDHSPSSEQAM